MSTQIICKNPLAYTARGIEIATQSFYEDLILNTPEAVANMEKAFDRYEREGGYKVKGELKLSTNYELLDRLAKEVRE